MGKHFVAKKEGRDLTRVRVESLENIVKGNNQIQIMKIGTMVASFHESGN
jgi:hypothetical protein